MVRIVGRILLSLTLALLVCGCGSVQDQGYVYSGCATKGDGKCADVNARNDLWIVDERINVDRFCVTNPEIGINYCTHDANDPEYQFWRNEQLLDEKRMKWLVKL